MEIEDNGLVVWILYDCTLIVIVFVGTLQVTLKLWMWGFIIEF